MLKRVLIILFALAAISCARPPEIIDLSGQTMGTRYTIKIVDHEGTFERSDLQAEVDATLEAVNARFSNWDPNSEVSRFNAAQANEFIAVSPAFRSLMRTADTIYAQSDGQFDVTLSPLIELWGFGASPDNRGHSPEQSAIDTALAQIRQGEVLSWSDDGTALRKNTPDASINFAAIAKGAGVDEVAEALAQAGARDFMVEIGGEVYAAGHNGSGQPWRLGIERPDSPNRQVEEIVVLSDMGMATSGDYRNYFEEDGVRYTHIIDAQTGRPVTHKTASVTVLAETSAEADAWATGLLALGLERGLEIAETHQIAVLFMVRSDDHDYIGFEHVASAQFRALQDLD